MQQVVGRDITFKDQKKQDYENLKTLFNLQSFVHRCSQFHCFLGLEESSPSQRIEKSIEKSTESIDSYRNKGCNWPTWANTCCRLPECHPANDADRQDKYAI